MSQEPVKYPVTSEADVVTVFNKPPFVNELLAAILPEHITLKMFNEMVKESRVYDLSTILTAMTRQIDYSGLVPNLAGIYDDPQEVLIELMGLGYRQLSEILQLDSEIQTEIFDTLKGIRCTLRALVILDERQREVISQLTHLRQQSALALAIRQSNEQALRELYKNPRDLGSCMFDEVIGYKESLALYQKEPRICYRKRDTEGNVVEVWQYYFMPRISKIRLPKEFGKLTVGQVVDQITPNVYKRSLGEDSRFDPRTPTGFMGLLGKVGGALPRLIARQVERNQHLRAHAMREEEIAEILFELFYR